MSFWSRTFISVAFSAFVFCGPAGTSAKETPVAVDPFTINPAAMYNAMVPKRYIKAVDFKAVAIAPPLNLLRDQVIIRFSFKYDTAQQAHDAALAYCNAARSAKALPEIFDHCRVIRLGGNVFDPEIDIPLKFQSYDAEVLARLRKTLKKTGNREVRTILTTVLQKTGRHDESESLLFKLAMEGEDLAQNALAYHWAELKKRLPEALNLADAAVKQRPDFFSFHDTRALVLLRLGRVDDAINAAQTAVSLETNFIALDHLGDIYWIAGRKEDARRQWRLALEESINILFDIRLRRKIGTGLIGDPVFE